MLEPTNHTESAADGDTPPTRAFLDADGTHWRVYEQAFAHYDRRSGLSLIFDSEAAVRRVRNYPRGWFELSDEDLEKLSWKA